MSQETKTCARSTKIRTPPGASREACTPRGCGSRRRLDPCITPRPLSPSLDAVEPADLPSEGVHACVEDQSMMRPAEIHLVGLRAEFERLQEESDTLQRENKRLQRRLATASRTSISETIPEDIVEFPLSPSRRKPLPDLYAFVGSDPQHDSGCAGIETEPAANSEVSSPVGEQLSKDISASSHAKTSLHQLGRSRSRSLGKDNEEDTRVSSCLRRALSMEWNDATLWQVWEDLDEFSDIGKQPSNARLTRKMTKLIQDSDVVRAGDSVKIKGLCQSFIVRPSSFNRATWDILSILCIGYDLLLIPMVVFDLSEVGALSVIAVILAIFWTGDMVFTFFVGFHNSGVIEMRPRKIAKRYLKTWFLFDLLVVTCDWFAVVTDSIDNAGGDSVGVARLGKSFRITRVFRALRFLRIWKLVHLVGEFNEYLRSENLMQMFGIFNFIIIILVINHYVACGWYAIAEYYPDGIMHTWLSELRSRSDHHKTSLFEYTSSLHWSFTQFTPASMEVHPHNALERIYSIVVLLSGMVVFSSFVSGITSAMTRVRENNKEANRQEENIRRYITDNKVSMELGRQIYQYLRSHSLMNKARLVETDISAFKALPSRLLTDLHAEVFLPVLTRHPFFYQFLHRDEMGLVEICHTAVREIAVTKGDRIFSFGERAHKMVFCIDGLLMYSTGPDGNTGIINEITAHDYLAEAALWVHWLHKGRLDAAGNCVLAELRVEEFHTVAVLTHAFRSCVEYAHGFAEKVFLDRNWQLGDEYKSSFEVSDIWYDDNTLQELARDAFEAHFQKEHRQSFGIFGSKARKLASIRDLFRAKSTGSSLTNSSLGSSRLDLDHQKSGASKISSMARG